MANLYEINAEITQLYDSMIDPETGEVNEELYARMNELEMDRSTKIENIALWIKNLKSDANSYKAEEKVFHDRRVAAENQAARLENYLVSALNGEKFGTDRCKITYRKSSSVECSLDDISTLPERYLRYGKPELNKTEIKAALEAGEIVDGCSILEKRKMLIS